MILNYDEKSTIIKVKKILYGITGNTATIFFYIYKSDN